MRIFVRSQPLIHRLRSVDKPIFREKVNLIDLYQSFLRQLQAFESGNLLSPGYRDGAYHRHLLQLTYEESTLCVSESKQQTRTHFPDLASILCAYRFADVISYAIASNSSQPPSISKTLNNGSFPTLHVGPLPCL